MSLCSFLTLIFVLFISNDRIDDRAVKTLITKEAQERDVVDPGGLEEAAAFKRIRLLRFLYFCDSELPGLWIGMYDLKRLPGKHAVREHDGHPCEICPDIKPDGEIGGVFRHRKYFLVMHNFILSGRHPFPEGVYTAWRLIQVWPEASQPAKT